MHLETRVQHQHPTKRQLKTKNEHSILRSIYSLEKKEHTEIRPTHPLAPAGLVGPVDLGPQHLDLVLDLLNILVDRGHLQLVLVIVRLSLSLCRGERGRKNTTQIGQGLTNGQASQASGGIPNPTCFLRDCFFRDASTPFLAPTY